MILKIFKNEEADVGEDIIEFTNSLQEEGFNIESNNLNDDETNSQAEIYQIFNSPSFVVTDDNGQEITSWRGIIPPLDEIKHYLSQ